MFKKMREDYSVKNMVLLDKSHNALANANACKDSSDYATYSKLAGLRIQAYDDMTKTQKVAYHTVKGLKPVAYYAVGCLAVVGIVYTYLADKNAIIVNPELLIDEEE
jgi:hypothetical protein